ncbi:hypothetical protein Bbelb_366460 [Branchiostoma belcheri]|nr:hypothetical protein Bbelb_366460 [Branchiostoma belcheri]
MPLEECRGLFPAAFCDDDHEEGIPGGGSSSQPDFLGFKTRSSCVGRFIFPGGFKATGPATDIQMFMIEDTDTPSDQTHGPSLLSAQNTTVACGPYGLPWPCPAPTCFHPGLSPLVKPSELPVFYPRINFGLPASSGKPSPPTADTHPVQPRVASFGPIPGLLPTARDRRVQNSPSGSDRTSPRVPSTSPSLEKTVSDRAEFRLTKDKTVSREVDISGGKRKRPEKKFPCPFCTVCCANNGQLKGHLRVHTGEFLQI